MAALSTIGALALLAVLSQGPLRVEFIGQRIASSLDARSGDRFSFDLGATYLERSALGATLVVDDFRVKSGGQIIVEAPHAEVSIDPLSLLAGDMRPRRLQVSNIDINLLVLPDGSISLAGGQKASPIAVAPAPAPRSETENPRIPRAALLAKVGGALRSFFDIATAPGGAIGVIERISIKSGRLIVDDRTADRRTVFEELDAVFDKTATGTDLVINAVGPNGPVSGEAHAQGVPGTLRTLDLSVRNISIDELILAGGVRNPNFDSDVKIAANVRFSLDGDGRVREASASFGLGTGYLRLADPDHEPYFIDELSGSAHWDGAARRIVIDPTHLFAADTRLTMVGTIDPASAADGGWKVNLGLAEPGTLAPERPGERILPIQEMGAEVTVFPFAQRAVFPRAVLRGPDIDVNVTGNAEWTDGLHVKFDGHAGQGPLRALLRVWPSHVGSSIRRWLISHAYNGTVRAGTIRADFDRHTLLMMRYNRPPPDRALTMDFTIVGGVVDTIAGLPPLSNLEAAVRVTGRTLRLDGKSGTLELSGGRKLTLQEGQLDMPRNDGSDAVPARLAIRAIGPVEAAVDLLAKEPFKAAVQMPFDPASMRGRLEGKMSIDFEIGAQASPFRSTVEANLTDVTIDKIVGKEKLEGATVAITHDANGLKASGTGRLFGGPATFDIRKPASQPATVIANVMLDDAARARAGYSLTGVTGPIAARINATVGADLMRAQVDLDLTRTGIENGIPGLTKPAGKPARLAFMLDQKNSGLYLDQMTFEGNGAVAKGVVELTTDGGFQSARLSQIRLSPGDDFRADITKGGDGIKIAVKAVNFDARPFLKLLTKPTANAPGTGGDFDLELKAPIITGFGKQVMSNVDLRLLRKASTIRQFTLNGAFGRQPVLAVMTRSETAVPQVQITTPNAGALFAFTDFYSRMEGGQLNTLLQIEAGRITGTVQVNNFVLKDEPAMRRLVIEGVPQQPTANTRVQARPDGTEVQFDQARAVFQQENGRVTIRDGVMNGQVLGLTVEGTVDDTRDTLNLNGTYVPAYGINNLFAKIPVVGLFLGGDWNEGLFAVNYRITGKFSAPVLNINPLSMVAPGFLRKIFGALDGTAQSAPAFTAPALPQSVRGTPRARAFEPSIAPIDPSGRFQ